MMEYNDAHSFHFYMVGVPTENTVIISSAQLNDGFDDVLGRSFMN